MDALVRSRLKLMLETNYDNVAAASLGQYHRLSILASQQQ